MLIRVGYDMAFHFPQPTAMVLTLSIHPSRASTIRHPECLEVQPDVAVSEFIDTFGNRCSRVFVHIRFDYMAARADRTALETWRERVGVCRDFVHLAITLCRCMNIPARYCTGYLGDIGVPPAPYLMDFSAWFEAFVGGQWYAFDPRHNVPRIGRVLMARGRDATDTALTTTFGVHQLESFTVWTDEISQEALGQLQYSPR